MSFEVAIRTSSGEALNARVEADDRGIVVHSRSGVDRNRDYREAVETILARLDAAKVAPDFYLDSGPVQGQSHQTRKLSVARSGSVAERFNELIRAMNAGTSSNGAWRRFLIVAPEHSPAELAHIVSEPVGSADSYAGRLPAADLRLVANLHIDHAVERLRKGEDAPNFSPSRDFDLLAPGGERLAPKKVFGLALEEATGMTARPEHFTAGLGTPCFEILERAGYPIVRKSDVIPSENVDLVDPDLAAAEGSIKLVTHLRRERNAPLAAAKRRATIAELGFLQCERCKVVPSVALGTYGDAVIEVHHTETPVGKMTEGQVTRLADLACLCANCHRIVHKEARMLASE